MSAQHSSAVIGQTFVPGARPDITLACGDCASLARALAGVQLASDITSIPFGAECGLCERLRGGGRTPMVATNALDLSWDLADRTFPMQPTKSTPPEGVTSVHPGHSRTLAELDRDSLPPPPPWGTIMTRQKIGPLTRIAADLLCAWSAGKPDALTPPDQAVASAVDIARRLLAQTGGT